MDRRGCLFLFDRSLFPGAAGLRLPLDLSIAITLPVAFCYRKDFKTGLILAEANQFYQLDNRPRERGSGMERIFEIVRTSIFPAFPPSLRPRAVLAGFLQTCS